MIFRLLKPYILIFFLSAVFSLSSFSQIHPFEKLGRDVFDSLKNDNFEKFFSSSIFSLQESNFKNFLYNVKNQNIRDHLTSLHKLPFPKDITRSQDKWKLVFEHNWREEWRHLCRNTSGMIKSGSFDNLLEKAEENEFQWPTVELLKVEVLVPFEWKNGRFEIKGDLDLVDFERDPRTLYLDRNIQYRLRPNKSTYAKTFMIGEVSEDSESIVKQDIIGNGSGQGDIILGFYSKKYTELFYFCPDQEDVGGKVSILDFNDVNQPNQRHDILLTMAYGKPTKFFQIQLNDVLKYQDNALFFGKPSWVGEVDLPKGILY